MARSNFHQLWDAAKGDLMTQDVLLQVQGLTKRFGGLTALDDVSFEVFDSEILGVIGPNGAGKSTLFNLICGFLHPVNGKVIFKGQDITGLKPHQISSRGITRCFQATRLFMNRAVLDNLLIGFFMSYKTGILGTLLNSTSARREEELARQKATELMELIELTRYSNQLARDLAYGHRRLLGLGLALATNPCMLLLDEPTTGMNLSEKAKVIDLLGRLRQKGITVVLVEHDMSVVMGLCDRVIVLNYGRKVAQGSPKEISANEEVIKAYLGAEE